MCIVSIKLKEKEDENEQHVSKLKCNVGKSLREGGGGGRGREESQYSIGYLLNPEYLTALSVDPISHSSLNGTHYILVLSLINFFLWMCPFDPIGSSGIEVDKVAFDQFWNVLLLFSGDMLSIRSLFTICQICQSCL